ncbi:MAG: hypothetical protein E6J91_39855 [Deltaproteobacteria bacterium]|nr:MAG: hypothetical protein E6J91_39855 [Deltaproteobacteria bacterium]
MVFGGPRFAHPERPARPDPAPRVIDVEARSPHKTLYEVLVVPPRTSSREIRRIARALRRHLPETPDFHDVCLAEQVLGRADLRAEYNALLARLRAAKQPIPNIGPAFEGARLGPSVTTRLGRAGRVTTPAAGKAIVRILQVALVIVLVAIIATVGGKSRSDRYRSPEIRPIQIPDIDLKRFELKPIDIPKFDLPKLDVPKFDATTLDPEVKKLLLHPPRDPAPPPRKSDPPPRRTEQP